MCYKIELKTILKRNIDFLLKMSKYYFSLFFYRVIFFSRVTQEEDKFIIKIYFSVNFLLGIT